MIFLFKKTPYHYVLKTINSNFPDHELIRFHDISNNISNITHILLGQSLFTQPRVIFLSQIDQSLWDQINKDLVYIPETTHIFWVEDNFPTSFLKKLPKHTLSEHINTEKELQKTNVFNLANNIIKGDGLGAWATYQQLINEGNDPEVLFGVVWWKIKDIAKKKEILSFEFKKIMYKLLSLYSCARLGKTDLNHGFELFLLNFSKNSL